MPVIGFLNSVFAQPFANRVAGFRAGLKETGYIDGQNVAIEFRWAEGHYDRLPGMAADLVRRKVAVLVSTGGAQSVVAAKAATSTIPIVFTLGVDPVQLGVVTSLGRPGGNITGVYLFTAAIESKRLGLLRALVPGVQLIAFSIRSNPIAPTRQGKFKKQRPLLANKYIYCLRATRVPSMPRLLQRCSCAPEQCSWAPIRSTTANATKL
jgi:putative tryptophan/tyrosine transport system substrate-binding protein